MTALRDWRARMGWSPSVGEIRNGVFYNDESTARRPRTNVDKMAGRAPLWLGIIAWIARYPGWYVIDDSCRRIPKHPH